MCGPAFEPDAAIALPQGQIAIMGPEPAVNAVYYNKIMELPESERAAYVRQKRDEYAQDVDTYKLASEMLIDDIVPGACLPRRADQASGLRADQGARVPAAPQRRLPRLTRRSRRLLTLSPRSAAGRRRLHYFVPSWRAAMLGIKCAKSETRVAAAHLTTRQAAAHC